MAWKAQNIVEACTAIKYVKHISVTKMFSSHSQNVLLVITLSRGSVLHLKTVVIIKDKIAY